MFCVGGCGDGGKRLEVWVEEKGLKRRCVFRFSVVSRFYLVVSMNFCFYSLFKFTRNGEKGGLGIRVSGVCRGFFFFICFV